MKTLLPIAFLLAALQAPADPAPASFAYVLQPDAFAQSRMQCISRLAASGRDWIVLDAFYGNGEPWSHTDLDAIRGGQSERRVIAYLSIGEAEDYRPYWHRQWGTRNRLTATAPAWLGAENPVWQGNYRVKYWDAQWQAIILSAVDEAMALGFDGLYLDIVDGFETFEQNGEEYLDNRVNPETEQSYRRDMVEWVKAVAARARTKNPAALVIAQNGSQLLTHADFLETIDAVGIEDLFTEGNKRQTKAHTAEVLKHLQKLAGAGKPALLVEYPENASLQALAKQKAQEHGLVWLVTDRPLKTLGQSGK